MLRRRRPFEVALPGLDVATVTARVQQLRAPLISRTPPPHELYLSMTDDGTVRVTRPASAFYGYPGLRGRLVPTPDGVTLTGEARESLTNLVGDVLMWTLALGGLLFPLLALDPPVFGPSPREIVLGGLGTAAAFGLVGLGTRWARGHFSRDVDEMVDGLTDVLTSVSPR